MLNRILYIANITRVESEDKRKILSIVLCPSGHLLLCKYRVYRDMTVLHCAWFVVFYLAFCYKRKDDFRRLLLFYWGIPSLFETFARSGKYRAENISFPVLMSMNWLEISWNVFPVLGILPRNCFTCFVRQFVLRNSSGLSIVWTICPGTYLNLRGKLSALGNLTSSSVFEMFFRILDKKFLGIFEPQFIQPLMIGCFQFAIKICREIFSVCSKGLVFS